MRTLSILLISIVTFLSLCGTSALARERIDILGTVKLSGSQFIFVESGTFRNFKLRAVTDSAERALSKLKNNDGISGSATLVEDTLLLESVEFVGLRRLIGIWQAEDTLVNFKDFSRVSFLLPQSISELNYAVSPSSGSGWKVFFSAESSVVLGSLEISGSLATIELFHPDTGETTKYLNLTKVTQ